MRKLHWIIITFLITIVGVVMGMVEDHDDGESRRLGTKTKSPKAPKSTKAPKAGKVAKGATTSPTPSPTPCSGPLVPFIETFGDLSLSNPLLNTTCNNLAINGITYGFSLPGVSDCRVFVGPGITTTVQDPSIEGSTNGTLTLDFDVETTIFGFGVVINQEFNVSGSTGNETVVVKTFNSSDAVIGEDFFALGADPALNFTSIFVWVGGNYTYTGTDAIASAEISFTNLNTSRFVVDNIKYETSCTVNVTQADSAAAESGFADIFADPIVSDNMDTADNGNGLWNGFWNSP